MSLIYLFTKIGRRTNHNDKSRTKKNNNIVKDTVYHLFLYHYQHDNVLA